MTGTPAPRASTRRTGLSVRVWLTLSYTAFVVVVGVAFAVVGFLVLRFIPEGNLIAVNGSVFVPSRGNLLQVFVRYAGLAVLLLAALGLVGGWFIAGRMLKPLTLITDAARSARDGSLDHRIRMPGRQNELAELADTFDDMLDRLGEAFAVQQRFAANASHELRTPLAVTAMMLEVAARHPDQQDYPLLLERLRITNDRAIGLTESLLRLADTDAIGQVAEPVDLADLVRAALDEHADEARRRAVTIDSTLDPATTVGDAALLAQLVGNLVQNGARHSGHGGNASISTGVDARRQVGFVRVESTGAVFDADTAARLAEPFLRGAGRVAEGDRGYGLGLALVQRIARVHGGALVIHPREQGGLVITVELPAD